MTGRFAFLLGMAMCLAGAPAGADSHVPGRFAHRIDGKHDTPGAWPQFWFKPKPTGGLPLWSDTFERGGVTYPFTMVGRDPRKNLGTTTVPALIVPLRFVFPAQAHLGASVFDASTDLVDGKTPVQGILQSPIFTAYPFAIGGQNIGTTQYVDAYARANFWSQLGPKRNYHLLLSPQVAPTQTINVPLAAAWETCDGDLDPMTSTCVGVWRPMINTDFLAVQLTSLMGTLGVTPNVLPIFVTGVVINSSFYAGAHTASGDGAGDQTWIWTSYLPGDAYDGVLVDVDVLGHEIIEWANDPFSRNDVPGWPIGPVAFTDWCYDRILEVAHPLSDDPSTESVPFHTASFTYHLPDAVFLDYFTHRKSRAAGGLYSLFGGASGPSAPCVGDAIYRTTRVDVPGALATHPYGINNSDDVAGVYLGQDAAYHSFARKHGKFSTFEVPGALSTSANAINDLGQIAGTWSDGVHYHGFLRSANGNIYTSIDIPGAYHTILLNVNNWGDVVGEYVNAGGDVHGFFFKGNTITTVDAPPGQHSAVTGINDHSDITFVDVDAGGAIVNAYKQTGAGVSVIQFPGATHGTGPGAIDNHQRVAGIFATDLFRYTDGFVMLPDGAYIRLPRTDELNGMNDHGEMVGFRDGHGFIATFPPGSLH